MSEQERFNLAGCGDCGAQISRSYRICPHCKAEQPVNRPAEEPDQALPTEDNPYPRSHSQSEEGNLKTKTCLSCDAAVSRSYLFCPHCGEEQPRHGEQQSSENSITDYAWNLANDINRGLGPSFVLWNGRTRFHVIIGRATPPDNLPAGLSLDRWRNQLREALTHELRALGWNPLGGNRFERRKPVPGRGAEPINWSREPSIPPRVSHDVLLQSQKAATTSDPQGNIALVSFIIAVALITWLFTSMSSCRREVHQSIREAQESLDEAQRAIDDFLKQYDN